MKFQGLLGAMVSPSGAVQATPDAYLAWATAKWGAATVGNAAMQSTHWGATADPDHDGIPNLIEYATDTDPTKSNPVSDCWQFSVPASSAPEYCYPQIITWLRTDDPDLRVIAQTGQDMIVWTPHAAVNFSQPQGPNPAVWEEEMSINNRGLRQIRYIDKQSMAQRSNGFMRLFITRRDAGVATPGIDPFSFTNGQTVLTGSTARSSAITLGGFAGTLTFSIPAGATVFINGVQQTGPTATVKAGDTLWMQATTPAPIGASGNFALTIGGHTANWSFTTGSIAAVPDHPGTDSGYTPVEAGVSEGGAAQISIPIVVSPGTAGMQPKLAITYSSQSGDGPLGLGFSLSGLSAISRVGATLAQDQFKGGIAFDAKDRFALDGQRLIAIVGLDGGDGTEYRLEFDPGSRIRSYGVEGSGPQRWLVVTKAGLKMEFGTHANSRVKPLGSAAAMAWTLEKVTDTVGNAISFTYDENARQQGELLLTQIAYTSNAAQGLVAKQEIICEYEDRPDTRTSYVAGFAVKRTKRLKALESRATDAGIMKRVRRYDLTYQSGEITAASQLVQVAELTTDGTALPPTTLNPQFFLCLQSHHWPAHSGSH